MKEKTKEKLKNSKAKVKDFWSEFKSFAMRGSAVELAIGIMIGTGFNELIKSMVNDVIMPPIGNILGNTDFSNLYVNLADETYTTLEAAEAAGAPLIKYGLFINNLLNFMILAFTVFIVLKFVLRYRMNEEK